MKKGLLFALAAICIIASITMYIIGNDSSHLSELKDFWYVPLPLSLIAILLAIKKN